MVLLWGTDLDTNSPDMDKNEPDSIGIYHFPRPDGDQSPSVIVTIIQRRGKHFRTKCVIEHGQEIQGRILDVMLKSAVRNLAKMAS
jgi:hypothetical protein